MAISPAYERVNYEMRSESATRLVDQLTNAIAHEEPVIAVLGTDEDAVSSIIDECVGSLLDQSIHVVSNTWITGRSLNPAGRC